MAVTDDAISKIRDLIISGRLKPGDKIPSETELSESLKISRNSLREAVKALELVNVLDVRRGDGTYVTELGPNEAIGSMAFILDLHGDQSIISLLQVRRILECAALELSVPVIAPAALERIEQILHQVDENSTVDDLVANDMLFHRSLAELSGNPYISGLLDVVASNTTRVRVWRGVAERNAVARTLEEHRQIVQALAQRDLLLAQSAMVMHINGVEQWVAENIAQK